MKPMDAKPAAATLNFSICGMPLPADGCVYAPPIASIWYQMTVNTKWKKERVIGKWKPPEKTFLLTSTRATEEATLPMA